MRCVRRRSSPRRRRRSVPISFPTPVRSCRRRGRRWDAGMRTPSILFSIDLVSFSRFSTDDPCSEQRQLGYASQMRERDAQRRGVLASSTTPAHVSCAGTRARCRFIVAPSLVSRVFRRCRDPTRRRRQGNRKRRRCIVHVMFDVYSKCVPSQIARV